MATAVSPRRGLVSVLVPYYKHANFVATAIESVLAHTSAQVEIVVWNDGPTDDTAAAANRYVYPRSDRQE
jgi:glycosyltransferase involved in cell wall biosynthesis